MLEYVIKVFVFSSYVYSIYSNKLYKIICAIGEYSNYCLKASLLIYGIKYSLVWIIIWA